MKSSAEILRRQLLPVSGIVNARDLGGYEGQGGFHVKSGMLFRAAHLAGATEADLSYLASVPTAKVIDFRMVFEKNGRENKVVPGAEYVCVPIDAGGKASADATEEDRRHFSAQKNFDPKKVVVMAAFSDRVKIIAREMYNTIIFNPDCQRQMALFFRELLKTEQGAVLFHCTQGKDRTGMASALILAALGADRRTIVKDFALTNLIYEKAVRSCIRRVRRLGGQDEEVAVVRSFIGANKKNFIETLDAIDAQYGSLDGYLYGPMNLTENDIVTLRKRYLE